MSAENDMQNGNGASEVPSDPAPSISNFNKTLQEAMQILTSGYGVPSTRYGVGSIPLVESLDPENVALRQQISAKEAEIAKNTAELKRALKDKDRTQSKLNEIKTRFEELSKKAEEVQRDRDLNFLIGRVSKTAGALLRQDPSFVTQFEQRKCSAFVISIDIRRSTHLMLRAKAPEDFANFLNRVCRDLSSIIKEELGVLDKFTGDGLLAYFPDFYSGVDAGLRALNAAHQCHETFARHYNESRNSFTAVAKGAGLGIGVDYGEVHLLRVTEELTVVGVPVVYACRLGGAPAGRTYFNHPAYAELNRTRSGLFESNEVEVEVKNEGVFLCYDVVPIRGKRPEPAQPEWMKITIGRSSTQQNFDDDLDP